MGNKFISVIVAVAVCVGLMLVPAVTAALPGGTATLLAHVPGQPANALIRVTPGGTFDMNVTLDNSNGLTLYGAVAAMVFDPALIQVNSITNGTAWPPGWTTYLTAAFDNTNGWVVSEAGVGYPINPVTQNITQCVVHFQSVGPQGTTTVNFTTGVNGLYDTKIANDTAANVLDWGSLQNFTVMIGTPNLTVTKVGNGIVKANGVPLVFASSNSTNRSWDENVTLQAIPDAGWAFSSWTGQVDGGAGNPNYVIMDELTKDVTVTFVELPPVLAVSPLSLAFSARYGNNTDNKTVTISNTGGGTLYWAVGSPPTWTTGDNWTYYDIYQPYAPLPIPGSNFSVVTQQVTGYGSNYQCSVAIAPPMQRIIENVIPAVLWNATMLVDEYSLDNVQQVANMTLWAPNATPVVATLTWVYDGSHGWPYRLYKSWTYNLTSIVRVVGAPPGYPPVVNKTVPCSAVVTNVSQTIGPFTDCYEITHFSNGTPFMQTWWSPTAKNFVLTADGGTYKYPPMDIRQLQSFNVADPPLPPALLSFNKTYGSLGTGASEVLKVTASTSGLAVGVYDGNFTISAPGSVQIKTVDVTLEVLPATTTDVIRNLPADALDMDAEYPGMTFDVWVNFTAPLADFNAIGLTDLAPAGWDVETNVSWCNPVASWTMSPGNKAEYSWSGPYPIDTVFTARYTVTIPATAAQGNNTWPNNDGTKAWAEYWSGAQGPYTSNVTGDSVKVVTVPGKIVGETRDVNADLLTTTLVVLTEVPPEIIAPEGSDSSTAPDAIYKIAVNDTGQYWLEASKYCYYDLLTKPFADGGSMPPVIEGRNPSYPDYIDFGNTAKLAAGCTLNFVGDYGLVPKACTMGYAMKSVNHWLFTPAGSPNWQLSNWKAMESVHSWQFPCGCNT